MMMPSAARTSAVLICLAASGASACSTFVIPNDGKPIFGRNYDWSVEEAQVIVNPRGVGKMGLMSDKPPTWVSRYGSVTFNQFGRELPCGGMNEAGLVVENMWLDDSAHPAIDNRHSLSVLQWIQYQLDNCATVGEVLATDKEIRVTAVQGAPLHYLVADRAGNCATIEFLGGMTIVHSGQDLAVPVLTNSPYAASVAYAKMFKSFGGPGDLQWRWRSLDRFACAADLVQRFDPRGETSVVEYAFDILRRVAQGDRTKWSIVYDLTAGRIHFHTHTHQAVRTLDLARLDFSCQKPAQMAAMVSPGQGDFLPELRDYTTEANRAQITHAFRNVGFLKDTPDMVLNLLATFPETLSCQSSTTQAALSGP